MNDSFAVNLRYSPCNQPSIVWRRESERKGGERVSKDVGVLRPVSHYGYIRVRVEKKKKERIKTERREKRKKDGRKQLAVYGL